MFIASPQQWVIIYFTAILMYLITFSKMSTTQSITSQTSPRTFKNFNWLW